MTERQTISRPTARPMMVRKPNRIDVIITNIIVFLKRLTLQLGKTLTATALASAADYIRKKSDDETAQILNKHSGNPTNGTSNQRNLYGPQTDTNQYSNSQYGTYGSGSSSYNSNNQYGNGYGNSGGRNYGAETFPGFEGRR